MSARLLFRIASVLLVLFAAGHTFGFLAFKPPTPDGLALRDAMNNIHFQVGQSDLSYGAFYKGFGLSITVYLLFSAFIAWFLGGLANTQPALIGPLGWVFFAVQIAILVLSWTYFSAAPAVLAGLVAACLGLAAWVVHAAKPPL